MLLIVNVMNKIISIKQAFFYLLSMRNIFSIPSHQSIYF
ncbi:Uncharacterised protein [Vibrio cholerae]|nr:Uncharacterised protein [Vibrio cholerae]